MLALIGGIILSDMAANQLGQVNIKLQNLQRYEDEDILQITNHETQQPSLGRLLTLHDPE